MWKGPKSIIIYERQYFAIFGFLEFIKLYSYWDTEVKKYLGPILEEAQHDFTSILKLRIEIQLINGYPANSFLI